MSSWWPPVASQAKDELQRSCRKACRPDASSTPASARADAASALAVSSNNAACSYQARRSPGRSRWLASVDHRDEWLAMLHNSVDSKTHGQEVSTCGSAYDDFAAVNSHLKARLMTGVAL